MLNFENKVWSWNLKVKFEVDVWFWSLRLNFKVKVWSWSIEWKFVLIEIWSRCMNLKLEVEVRSGS